MLWEEYQKISISSHQAVLAWLNRMFHITHFTVTSVRTLVGNYNNL